MRIYLIRNSTMCSTLLLLTLLLAILLTTFDYSLIQVECQANIAVGSGFVCTIQGYNNPIYPITPGLYGKQGETKLKYQGTVSNLHIQQQYSLVELVNGTKQNTTLFPQLRGGYVSCAGKPYEIESFNTTADIANIINNTPNWSNPY